MPTYDYVCEKCGNRFEVFEGMSAEGKRKCPRCGGPSKRQLGGGLGFINKDVGGTAGGQSCDLSGA